MTSSTTRRPAISNQAMEAAIDAYAWKAECDRRETLRKARHALTNPDGRESITLTRTEKVALLVTVLGLVAAFWRAL